MIEQLIKVHDVSQEYWHIERTPCSCGGRLRVEMQALFNQGETPIDRLMARCNMCKEPCEFLFDISAFNGNLAEVLLCSEISDSIDDKVLKRKVLNAASSPVCAAVQAILAAGEENDHLALDWLEDTIHRARNNLALLRA